MQGMDFISIATTELANLERNQQEPFVVVIVVVTELPDLRGLIRYPLILLQLGEQLLNLLQKPYLSLKCCLSRLPSYHLELVVLALVVFSDAW